MKLFNILYITVVIGWVYVKKIYAHNILRNGKVISKYTLLYKTKIKISNYVT